MASIDWPETLVTVLRDGYAESTEPNVRRTEMEDGIIVQERTTTRDLRVRRYTVLVTDENATEFLTWCRTNSTVWFNFADIDGSTRDARLRGGSGAVQLTRVAGQLLGGERYSRAEIEIEGY